MERVQKQHRLDCLRQVEKAIGNVERIYIPRNKDRSKGENQAITHAKEELNKAWEFHLKRFY